MLNISLKLFVLQFPEMHQQSIMRLHKRQLIEIPRKKNQRDLECQLDLKRNLGRPCCNSFELHGS